MINCIDIKNTRTRRVLLSKSYLLSMAWKKLETFFSIYLSLNLTISFDTRINIRHFACRQTAIFNHKLFLRSLFVVEDLVFVNLNQERIVCCGVPKKVWSFEIGLDDEKRQLSGNTLQNTNNLAQSNQDYSFQDPGIFENPETSDILREMM